MHSPVCIRCHRPLRTKESIARGYGSECYRIINDDIHAGLLSLSMMCVEMSKQQTNVINVTLPKINIEEIQQISLIEELFKNEQN